MGWGFGMQWHQLDHMQTFCTLLVQTDNRITSTPHHSSQFLRARCSSGRPTNSVKGLKAGHNLGYSTTSITSQIYKKKYRAEELMPPPHHHLLLDKNPQ